MIIARSLYQCMCPLMQYACIHVSVFSGRSSTKGEDDDDDYHNEHGAEVDDVDFLLNMCFFLFGL